MGIGGFTDGYGINIKQVNIYLTFMQGFNMLNPYEKGIFSILRM